MIDLPLVGFDQANELINSPELVSGMVREGQEDYPALLPNWDIAESYITPYGGWYFIPVKNRIHEAHVFYLKSARGKWAMRHSESVFRDMSRKSDKLIGQIGLANRLACRFVERLGCSLVARKTGDYWISDTKTDLGLYVYEFKKVRQLS